MQSNIEHIGIIKAIQGSNILVELEVKSACASCHAKSMCSLDSKTKTIEVCDPNTSTYNIGETVKVIMRQSLGSLAVVLSYILPFIILFFSLILLLSFNFSELLSSLISISLLIPYYFILYFNRDKLSKRFQFNLEKI